MIKNYLVGINDYEIRFGFSHILAIFDKLDKKVIPDSEKKFYV